ncbi:enoyl-CoA hydratase/isomerase family protein [Thermoplasma sp.]|uniref:enoyl-CoA hydratase/isomerase family protein n=1 Tax=Thermoplasma sp. TaxID=1973142 RepID=UPI00126CF4CD|nr:enoyl-CoA hydratase/isomerase family protein [Thermoplasma sp.]KAA8922877.1 MAG: enoyl-CoA hydratase/isomerase family protein [Thermoplasma sp.]
MTDIRVRGYRSISFWQEEGIGLIVIRSDSHGEFDLNTLDEITAAMGIAAMDESVKSVAITGMNNVFGRRIVSGQLSNNIVYRMMQSSSALISMIYSLEKPVFAILNGDAIDEGYEIALLADMIISADDVRVGFEKGYEFKIGGSFTSLRMRRTDLSVAEEGINVDRVLKHESLLETAKEIIEKTADANFSIRRKQRYRGITELINMEKLNFYEHYLMRT